MYKRQHQLNRSPNHASIKNKHPIKLGNIAAKGYLGLIYTLLYLPIIVLVVMSFNKSKIGYNWGGFSLKWYESLLNNQAMLDAFWHVVLPLTTPGIISGVLLVLLPAMGMFYVADILGGSRNLLVGNIIKNQFLDARDWPFGAAASVLLTLSMAVLLLAYRASSRRIGKTDFSEVA